MKITTIEELRKAVTEPEKILVYNFGGTPAAGFCADYLRLLWQLMQCLNSGIGFRFGRTTRPRGFVTQKGWSDYFEPFCGEVDAPLLNVMNVWQFPFARKIPITKFVARIWLRNLSRPRADYFMFDKLGEINSLRPSVFDENQSYFSARQDLMRILWAYNPATKVAVRSLVQKLNLPHNYLAICIRRGDKISEYPYVEIEPYVEKIYALNDESRTIFIATDDYRVIPKLAEMLRGYKLVSLTERESCGYNNAQFICLPADERRRRTIILLATMEILRDSWYFFGANITNVSHIANSFRGGERVIWVDNAEPEPKKR